MALRRALRGFGRPARDEPRDPETERRDIVERFHKLYYDSQVWKDTRWLGVLTQKLPLDLWIYQELVHDLRPDVVVETGTLYGGSAYYLASICELIGSGRVVSVDIENRAELPRHPRITYIQGLSSVDPEAVRRVHAEIQSDDKVMLILDSDHSQQHVTAELEAYADLVTPGQYLVVEDTNVFGHPVLLEHGPGPMEAVVDFVARRRDFELDASREKFFLTFNPRGFLRRTG